MTVGDNPTFYLGDVDGKGEVITAKRLLADDEDYGLYACPLSSPEFSALCRPIRVALATQTGHVVEPTHQRGFWPAQWGEGYTLCAWKTHGWCSALEQYATLFARSPHYHDVYF